jgi:hypothetical protein
MVLFVARSCWLEIDRFDRLVAVYSSAIFKFPAKINAFQLTVQPICGEDNEVSIFGSSFVTAAFETGQFKQLQ